MRARDADRTGVCRILDDALAEGQLTGEEHRERVAAATRATTLGELEGLVTDLQATAPAVPPPRPRGVSPRGLLLAGAAAAGVLAVVIVVVVATAGDPDPAPAAPRVPELLAESPVAPTEASDPEPDEVEPSVVTMPTEFHTVTGMTALLDTIRQRFGDTTGIELAIWRDSAMLLRPDPGNDQEKQLYRFRNGWGDPSNRERDPNDRLVDLGAFDVAAMVAAVQAAPATVGIAPDDVSEVVLDIDEVQDAGGTSALEAMVKVSSTSGGSGFVFLDGAGAVKSVEHPR